MSTKIVASMSMNSVGCTFLDWSVLYLSGQDQFYSFKEKDFLPLTQDPITPINAHGHKKNHFAGSRDNIQHIEEFLSKHSGLLTLYPLLSALTMAAEHFGIDVESPEFVENINGKLFDFVFEDGNTLWQYLHNKQAKIIWITEDPNLLITHLTKRSNEGRIKSLTPTTFEEIDREFQELFYQDSQDTWSSLGLDNIWDERERRALDLRPLSFSAGGLEKEQRLPFHLPHLHLTTAEWWTQGEAVIQRVMNFCELPIDPSRWDHWVEVYSRWKSNLTNQLSFCYRLPTMLNAIVNNWYYELGELSFIQEVAIQHYLIYKYNLNLKTWNLTKFPANAQDLHKLLEPNIHSVDNIYNV